MLIMKAPRSVGASASLCLGTRSARALGVSGVGYTAQESGIVALKKKRQKVPSLQQADVVDLPGAGFAAWELIASQLPVRGHPQFPAEFRKHARSRPRAKWGLVSWRRGGHRPIGHSVQRHGSTACERPRKKWSIECYSYQPGAVLGLCLLPY